MNPGCDNSVDVLDPCRPHQVLIQALVLDVGNCSEDTSLPGIGNGDLRRPPITKLSKSMFHSGIGLGHHSIMMPLGARWSKRYVVPKP